MDKTVFATSNSDGKAKKGQRIKSIINAPTLKIKENGCVWYLFSVYYSVIYKHRAVNKKGFFGRIKYALT